jgi:hypothetical protein
VDLIMLSGGFVLWTVLLACAWLILVRSDAPPDDPETVVGVQRHGRTYFIRRDMLDSLDGHYEPSLWHRLRETLIDDPGLRLRAIAVATVLTLMAILGFQQFA